MSDIAKRMAASIGFGEVSGIPASQMSEAISYIQSLQAQNSKLLAQVTAITQKLDRYKHTPEAYAIMQEAVRNECERVGEAEALNTRYKEELHKCRGALELAHEHMKLHIPQYRSTAWNVHRVVKAALKDTSGEEYPEVVPGPVDTQSRYGMVNTVIPKKDMVLVPREPKPAMINAAEDNSK